MPAQLTAVTALYDIGRRDFGRPIEQYVGWLNATLRLPTPFTIFLDPNIDAALIQHKPGDRVLRVPMEDFYPFRWEERIAEIGAQSNSQDLTFTLRRYPLLMFSKFDMLQRVAADDAQKRNMLWIDAGLSRFVKQDMAQGRLVQNRLDDLEGATFAAPAPAWGIKQIRNGTTDALVGTSPRLITGCDLYCSHADAADTARRIYDLVENDWLPKGKWDNEQVAMGCLLAKSWPGFKLPAVTSKFGAMVEDLFALRLHRRGLPGRIERWIDGLTGQRA